MFLHQVLSLHGQHLWCIFSNEPFICVFYLKVVHTLPRRSVCCNLHAHHMCGLESLCTLAKRFAAPVRETPASPHGGRHPPPLARPRGNPEPIGMEDAIPPLSLSLSIMTLSLPQHPCCRVGRADCCFRTSMSIVGELLLVPDNMKECMKTVKLSQR